MKIIVTKSYEEMSKLGAEEIVKLISFKSDCVLGLATGSTPQGMYKELISLYKANKVDFSGVTSVNLDEYIGLKADNPQSYKYFMENNLFNHVNINKKNTFIPNGTAIDMEKECRLYDERIEELGGIDLQILGIGQNGHIGFNEPSDFLSLSTHVTNLSKDTIEANSRFFQSINDVPTQAITMGLGSIMKAKKILLLASGENKAEIISKLAEGIISTTVPASLLQVHRNVLIIVDEKAAALLKKSYEFIYEMA